jgi:cell division protein ZapA (FtsZ GTPase activity inhibitor)
MAFQNAVWLVEVAKCGFEDGFRMFGHSVIVSPSGEIVAKTSSEDDEVIVHNVDLALGENLRKAYPERNALIASARHLDEKMREIRATGKIVGLERIAVMAALNLTHEALATEGSLSEVTAGTQREVDRLTEKVGRALGDLRQLKI